ncbi:MAG: S8 family serine peptidase [Planctomycetota bacterium]
MRRPNRRMVALTALILSLGLAPLTAQERVSSRLGPDAPTLAVSAGEIAAIARDGRHWPELVALADARGWRTVDLVPERRVLIADVGTTRRDAVLAELRADARVDAAFPLHRIGSSTGPESRYFLTREVVVAFEPDLELARRREILAENGLVAIRSLRWCQGAQLVKTADATLDPLAICATLDATPGVRFSHPNWLRRLGVRDTYPADPLFGNQWHLLNIGQGAGLPGADLGAVGAWDLSLGAGTTIAVIDTGVDQNHGDLAQTALGFDPQLGPGVGNGHDVSGHGTRVAGCAAAHGGNGYLVSGVSWQSTIMPIRLLTGSGYGTPTEESDCFVHAADNGADVITNSWGPDGVPFPLPALVDAALQYVTSNGRNGLGCPVFWAAGNGNEDVATDGYVSSAYTIAVGATTNFDVRAIYSDFGVALDLVAPSSGGTRAITTTDLGGSITLMFTGTSASAPQAAGAAALMISANPALTWMQVRDFMRNSAQKVQPLAANYDAAGHSLTYGYGRLDAHGAVMAAVAAAPTPPSLLVFSWGIGDINVCISDLPPFGEWALGVSSQLYSPVGSGPLFGLGWDSVQTFLMPAGAIPFHYFADAAGGYQWGAVGLPPGLTFQTAVVGVMTDGSLLGSNVLQVSL